MNYIHFFIYSEDDAYKKFFRECLHERHDTVVVSLAQQRFYTKHWPQMEAYVQTLAAGPILISEEDWFNDLHAKLPIGLWRKLQTTGAEHVYVVLPAEYADILKSTRPVLYKVLYWKPDLPLVPGMTCSFNMREAIPEQRPISRIRSIRECLRKKAIA